MRFFAITLSVASVSAATLRGGAKINNKETNNQRRHLATVNGECTVSNFATTVGGEGQLASLLNTATSNLATVLKDRCDAALNPTVDLSIAIGKGPQFLKNFLDGGSTWNDHKETPDGKYKLSEDAAIIPQLHDQAETTVFGAPDGGADAAYPGYFSNFHRGDKECPLGVIQCCYTGSRSLTGSFTGNANMCALDLADAGKSNHIHNHAYTVYDSQSQDQAYCAGFAYEDGSFGDAVKYNTLFHIAMKTNLYDKGYVRNIPGAPLCGCVEQMPIVDNSECIKAVESYKIDGQGNISANISWSSCDGKNLKEYYDSLDGRTSTEKAFVDTMLIEKGECAAASTSFMNEQMYRKA